MLLLYLHYFMFINIEPFGETYLKIEEKSRTKSLINKLNFEKLIPLFIMNIIYEQTFIKTSHKIKISW